MRNIILLLTIFLFSFLFIVFSQPQTYNNSACFVCRSGKLVKFTLPPTQEKENQARVLGCDVFTWTRNCNGEILGEVYD